MVKRILFVQHGDFSEAYRRLALGGDETYRDQKASVDFAAGLAPTARVTVFSFGNDTPLVELAPNLFSLSRDRDFANRQWISALFDDFQLTHLVLRTPHLGFLREAVRRKVPVLPIFADIFSSDNFLKWYRNFRLRRALLSSDALCFSNHSLNASWSMVEALGLPKEKIVPWDWTRVPVVNEAKSQVRDPRSPSAFFAGALSVEKGVGDCLDAISILRKTGIHLRMSFAGPGDTSKWREQAERLGIEGQVEFLGMIPNSEVRVQMHNNDFVVVPSRHNYPEGLPNTIYEGLASRSALVISDHPAFEGRLKPESECLVFSAADPKSLSLAIRRGIADNDLYERLSRNSPSAHNQLYVGMEWTSLLSAFLDDPTNRRGWVRGNTLEKISR